MKRTVEAAIRSAIVAGLVAPAMVLTSGCAKPPPKPVEKPRVELTLQTARGKRQFDDSNRIIRKFDTNRDGDPDIWKVYKKVKDEAGKELEVLERAELDLNFDKKIDLWRFYNDKGELVREEMDLDFDGKIDVAVIYEGGKVVSKEYAQGFDENPRVWKNYENGQLVRISRITKQAGKLPDTFEIYEDGQLAAVGYDRDGDGKPDVWEKVIEPEKQKKAKKAADGGAPASTTAPQSPPTATPDGGAPATTPTTPPEAKPSTTPEAKPATTPEAKPATTPEAKPAATPEAKPATTPEAKPAATPEAKPATTPEAKPATTTPPATDAPKPK